MAPVHTTRLDARRGIDEGPRDCGRPQLSRRTAAGVARDPLPQHRPAARFTSGRRLNARTSPARDEVHLWRAVLDTSPATGDWLERPLSADERERVRRYRAESDGARFACRRGWLRHLLADYLAIDPADLDFTQDARGKPCLRWPDVPWLRFNLSHSAGVAVFAIARSRDVGVDVEEVRRDFPFDAVARLFFSTDEQRALQALSTEDRIHAFFIMWTQREA